MKRRVHIAILAVCLAITVLFSGCALMQKAQDKVLEVSLTSAIDFAIYSAVGENEEIARVADSLQKRVQMKVVSSVISGEGLTAQCVITAPDLTEFIGSFDLNDYQNEQELCDAVIAAIENAPATQKEVTVGLKKTDSGYDLLDLEAFLNAYFGGGIDILNELQDQIK